MPPELQSNNIGANNTEVKPSKSPDDVLDILSNDSGDDKIDLKEPRKVEKEPKKQEKSEDPDDDELDLKDDDEVEDDDDVKLKDDESEEDEDKLDLKNEDEEIKIETPPRKSEITKEFPDFFRKFPWFEKMMFRDKQYTELFGTFEDAKEVKASADLLDRFEGDLSKGDSTSVLKQIKDNAPETFDKVVDNYLPNLFKVDQEAYYHVIGNITKSMVKSMYLAGKKANDADLITAAKELNKFMLGSEEYEEPTTRSKQKPQEENEVEKERKEFYQERFETARNDLQTKVDNVLRSTITDYIDPKSEMSPFVKKHAVREALDAVHEQIKSDPSFSKNLERLWQEAFRQKFSQNSLTSIRSAYLGKAKTLLQGAIKKAKAEALKGAAPASRKKQEEKDDDEPTPQRRRTNDSGTPRRQSGNDRNKPLPGESALEFLSRD